jgi:hypothetical protein
MNHDAYNVDEIVKQWIRYDIIFSDGQNHLRMGMEGEGVFMYEGRDYIEGPKMLASVKVGGWGNESNSFSKRDLRQYVSKGIAFLKNEQLKPDSLPDLDTTIQTLYTAFKEINRQLTI